MGTITVSNGRGGADGVVDYDDNKGLGLRLKLTYANPNVEVAPDGCGYYGEVTDKWFTPLYAGYGSESVLHPSGVSIASG